MAKYFIDTNIQPPAYLSGLSQRAQHPPEQLNLLHGSLYDIKCTSFYCDYIRHNDFTDPIVPALDIPKKASFLTPSGTDKTGAEASSSLYEALEKKVNAEEVDISNADNPIPELTPADLPQCPKCKGLLRPGVVWFGEALPTNTIKNIDNWIESAPVDLILVIGTSSSVYPAALYVDVARERGAKVVVVNMEKDMPNRGQGTCDWFFQGDASVIVPEILKSVIGDV